jgi:Type IX secretion system protein PorV
MNWFRPTYRHFLALSLAAFFTAGVALHARAQILPALGGERAGTSGFQFLKIPIDARSASLGNSVVASAADASVIFWNPALAAQLKGNHVGLYHTAYFVDVSLSMAAATYQLKNSGITIGGSIQSMNSGEMDVTTEFQPFGTGQTFQLTDIAVGLTISQALTDLFSYGITTKYIRESVVDITAQTVAFDMGIFYRVGSTGAQMAVAIRNFGFDAIPTGTIDRKVIADDPVKTEDEFERITPPTTFHLAAMYELLRSNPTNSVKLTGELSNPSDHSENVNFGAEYTWNDLLSLRIGYRFGIEEYRLPGMGIGLNVPLGGTQFRFDYGFSELERLGSIHRFGFNLVL